MSIIIPANSAVGGGYDVDNSCRFNEPSSDKLTRSNGTPTSQQKFTHSVWVKRSTEGNFDVMQGFYSNSNNYCAIDFLSTDRLDFINYEGGTSARKITTAKFRDFSAWYHIVVAVDTTLGTANDRIKMYVNGVLETVFDTNSAPSQNANLGVDLSTQAVGVGEGGGIGYLQGYLAESVYIDGTQNDVTDFGEFDEDTGIWKPIDVSGLTFGNNGFYLDYGNSAALGADVSGNGNNFTVNNLTAVDQSTDTCTNNFATLNGVSKGSGSTFAEGNLKVTTTISNYNSSVASIGATQGKWYWEMKLGNSGGSGGVTNYSMYGITTNSPVYVPNLSQESEKWTYLKIAYGSDMRYNETGGSYVSVSYGSANSGNDIVMIALDLDNNFIYMGANGSWYNSGNPTSGASGTGAAPRALVAGNTYFPSFTTSYGTSLEVNFGSPPYAISSGNADGNGYGNFEYAVPSGYFSLNTKNLAEYG